MRAVASGGRRLVEVLESANADDPWLAWTLPDPGARRSLLSLFLRTVAFPHGEVLVASDGLQAPVEGIAVLLPPWSRGVESGEVGAMVLQLHGPRAGMALDADAVIDRYRPTEPMWVLHSLAVLPRAQGRGLGRALLSAAVARAGAVPIAVETATARARDLYLDHGFTLDATVDLADGHGLPAGAPTVWLLSHRP